MLGDGTSRNPSNRDELIAQRSKDLEGIIGMARGFDLDDFLRDYEQPGSAIPWALNDHGWVATEVDDGAGCSPVLPTAAAHGAGTPLTIPSRKGIFASIAKVAANEGVPMRVKILYVADYVPT